MPNEKNLIPNSERTPSERQEIAAAGGRASGVSRRRKKSLKEAADLYLSLPVANRKAWNKIAAEGVDPEDVDNQMAMVIGLTKAAIRGDAKAARIIIDLLGEDAHADDPGRENNLLDAIRQSGEVSTDDIPEAE